MTANSLNRCLECGIHFNSISYAMLKFVFFAILRGFTMKKMRVLTFLLASLPAVSLAADLQWADSDNGSDINWKEATKYCAGKGKGWRLPTVPEIQASYQSGHSIPCGSNPFGGKVTCKLSSNSRLTKWTFWTNEFVDGTSTARYVSLSGETAEPERGAVGFGSNFRALCVRRP